MNIILPVLGINEHSFFFGTLYLKEQVMFSIKYVGQNSAFFYKAFVFTEETSVVDLYHFLGSFPIALLALTYFSYNLAKNRPFRHSNDTYHVMSRKAPPWGLGWQNTVWHCQPSQPCFIKFNWLYSVGQTAFMLCELWFVEFLTSQWSQFVLDNEYNEPFNEMTSCMSTCIFQLA